MPSDPFIERTLGHTSLNHRLSAGALVEHDGQILLVRHRKEGHYDFWVAPGGGVQGTEELAQAAAREVKEETGLRVAIGPLLYVEEFHNPDTRHCKFWFAATLLGGNLSTSAPDADAEHIVEARWHTKEAIAGLQVFPSVLQGRYWTDRVQGFPGVEHLGLREMAFW